MKWISLGYAALLLVSITSAHAEPEIMEMNPPPAAGTGTGQERITPASPSAADADILTTHDAPKPAPKAMPFGRGESSGTSPYNSNTTAPAPVIPSAPHATVAVPVVGVDSVEASEAAPPTPVDPAADPVAEDPAQPTELTSPIFEADPTPNAPRTIVIRALNKVTAQSELLTLKPGDTVKFGQLLILGVTCRTSSSNSQTDYAALLDVMEKLPTGDNNRPLFRGWMYASSPSITSIEHPIYDISMVECKLMPTAKKEPTPEKPPAKKAKK